MTVDEPYSETGSTIVIYLPKEAPRHQVEALLSRVSELAYVGVFPDRESWNPSVFLLKNNACDVDRGIPHIYLATSCLHGEHEYCKGETGIVGAKVPATCKFCAAPCICQCHQEEGSGTGGDAP